MEPDLLRQSRLAALSISSKTLGAFAEDDREVEALLGQALPGDRSELESSLRIALRDGGMGAVRLDKRRLLAAIAAADLAGEIDLEDATARLSDLADACLKVTLDAISAPDSLAVIAMGKLGARELNYYSDIDVMFVAEGDLAAATKSAELLLQELGSVAPEGQAYQIDTNLRPEGRSGALVRSLEGFFEYYERWADHWEYQALIKARAAAGNESLGSALVEGTRRFVFPDEVGEERIASIRRMKERVETQAARSALKKKATDADDVKLGPGGIRDIEFSVQLLQLVHGASDPSVRAASTLRALAALVEGGYVAEEDGAGLEVAYSWLRTVEHRLQLWQERRVRRLPTELEALSRLARSLGFKDSPGAGAAERFQQRHRAVLADVRGRFEKLFYRPMIEALADAGAIRMSGGALRDRLRVLGFRDVDRAVRTLDGIVSGASRRAKLFRVLTPAMLRFLATTPMPDEGLLGFLKVGEAAGSRLDALGALRDNPPGLEFLAKVLGSGRLLGEVLLHLPEELHAIAQPQDVGPPKDRDRLVQEAIASLGWREPERRLDGLRRFKRREMLAVALADLAGTSGAEEVGSGLADLADACLEAALGSPGVPFAVIGMGKLGGRELNYSSDIDVMFVHHGDQREGEALAVELMRAIGEVTPEGQAFRIDADLRPEGRSGALARSLDSYLEYYERWASPWEHQALLKARWAAGDRELADKLIDKARRYAWPEKLPTAALTEIRHLKARMERERIPRGSEARRHFKLGPGGLSDIEFAAQVLQLQHAHRSEPLRVSNTFDALRATREEGILDEDIATQLIDGYSFLMRLRNRLFFMMGRPVDALPARPEDLEALGIAMGFLEQPRQELEETYLRITRRVRKVADPIIYGRAAR